MSADQIHFHWNTEKQDNNQSVNQMGNSELRQKIYDLTEQSYPLAQ